MTATTGSRASASADTDAATPAVETENDVGVSQIDRAVSACDLALSELGRHVADWQLHERGARAGDDPEDLHRLRVTARRIDATISLFSAQLPPALIATRKTTKSVLRTLGAARDLDVQLQELAGYCDHLAEEDRVAAEPLRERLEREQAVARSRMIRGLDSTPVRRWLETLGEASQAAQDHGGEPAIQVMPARVRQRFRKLRKSVGKLRPKSSMDDYHQVRRRAKQLRYATECGASLIGKPADELLKALRRLQDKLGAYQDAHIAQQRLAALAAQPEGLPPATLFLMGRFAEQQRQITREARRTLERSWRKVRGKRWKALRGRLESLSDAALTQLPAEAAPAALVAGDIAPQAQVVEARTFRH
jgi:CHAD domain-containing protein